MPASQMSKVIQHLRRTLLVQEAADGQLLECFVSRHEEAALEVLVRRHGPMVWGVCRRILGNHHDAEDAFQATFLVLVRKAASIVPKEMVGNWLYGVAHQTALKARATAAKRKKRECQVTTMPEASVKDQDLWCDLQPLLDQELSRLPDKYRLVILLCDLEGKTRKEAARQIGCPEGTVATRLARGRVLLAKRLARHGLAVSGGSLAAVLAQNASACVPASVVSSTINAVTLCAAGQGAMISAKVIALTEGMLRAMFLTKLKTVMTVLLVVGMTVFGGGLLTYHHTAQAQPGQAGKPAAAKEAVKTGGASGQVANGKVWKERKTLSGHADQVLGVACSADLVAVVSKDGSVKLWDAATGKERYSAFRRHTGKIGWTAFSPDGRYLYSSSQEEDSLSILIMDAATDLSKDGTTSGASTSGEDVVLVFALEGEVWAQGNGNLVKIVKMDLAEQLKGKQPKLAEELTTLKGHQGQVRAAAFSLDGKTVVTGAEDKTVRVWDVETGKEKSAFRGHAEPVVFVASGPDGKIVASVSKDGAVKLWDVTAKKEILTLKDQKGVRCAVFSPDGKLVAIGGDEGVVRVIDAATGQEQARLRGHKDSVRALAFSPDGRTIISGSQDKTVKLWQLEETDKEKRQGKEEGKQKESDTPPKEFDPKVVEAWKKAGAKVGWYQRSKFGSWHFVEEKPKDLVHLPAFSLNSFEPGVIVKLPAPSVSFGLVLRTGGTTESGMTDAGLKELAGLKSLQALDLNSTKVTDAGLKELVGFKSLQILDLGTTKVTDVGLKDLAGLKSLQALNLAGARQVTDVGLKELAGLKNLQILNLERTLVTDAGLKDLAGLKSLQVLELAGTQVTDGGLTELADLKSLQILELTSTKVTDGGLKLLAGLENLQILELTGTKVTDTGLKELAPLKSLQVLGLTATQVTDAGLKELAGFKSLYSLYISGPQVTDAGLKELAGFKSLQVLGLHNTGVTDAGVAQLRKIHPNLVIVGRR